MGHKNGIVQPYKASIVLVKAYDVSMSLVYGHELAISLLYGHRLRLFMGKLDVLVIQPCEALLLLCSSCHCCLFVGCLLGLLGV